MTAGELAQILEVSVRTIYRYVDELSAAGIPICTARGKDGGVYLMDGCVLDRAVLSDWEQKQILTALKALPEMTSESLITKLSGLFRRQGGDWIQVSLSRWGDHRPDADKELFKRLRQAIEGKKEVTLHYVSANGQTGPRRVRPIRLVYKGQGWYLQGYDIDRLDYRTFRLTRIVKLRESSRAFTQIMEPPDVAFPQEPPPQFQVECVLRFAPAVAFRVYDEFDRECVTNLPDGRLEVHAILPEDQWLYGYLLSFGAGVEIVSPVALRQRMAQLGKEIFYAHQNHDTPCQVFCGTMGPSQTEEVPIMDHKDMKFCQSCGMPLTPELYGTETDGSPSEEYCSYCYQGGQFTREMTMEEMIDFCTPIMAQNNPGMSEEQARAQMHQFFPLLKRWKA